jgi:hypothetical protein
VTSLPTAAPSDSTSFVRRDVGHLGQVALRVGERLGLSREEAEDLRQAVLVDYLANHGAIDNDEGWIRLVARRKAYKVKYRPESPAPSEALAGVLGASNGERDAVRRIELSRIFQGMRGADVLLWWDSRIRRMGVLELARQHRASASTIKRRLRKIDGLLERRRRTRV